jgi:Zn-dependent peptidase ImmA (M78 family)/transcriptional regulator with XRE-family HTH domain
VPDVHDVNVTPAVLEWARKTIGWDRKQAAARLGLPTSRLNDMETGSSRPTWGELRKMAKAYHRPPAALLLSTPPEEPPLPGYFRTLDNEPVSAETLSSETLLAVRRARHIRNLLVDLEGERAAERRALPRAKLSDEPGETARLVSDTLGVVEPGTNPKFTDERDAIRKWRGFLYKGGILALQLPIPVDEARGFSIPDDSFPVIVASQHDSPKARVFTLFHELGHIVLRNPGICEISFRSSKDPGNRVERFCNAFAGRMLVPDRALDRMIERLRIAHPPDETGIAKLSAHFCVSQEVVLRRMLDTRRLSLDDYRERTEALRAGYSSGPPPAAGGGADYVRLRFNEYGPEFANLVLHSVDEGRLTYRDAVDFLGLKVDHLVRVREFIDRETERR